jgi:exonuclease SbcC
MIIKNIYLENIRSFKDINIDFPVGSTLLWGNIGSGKTSILLAIEFALFGLQPGQKGVSLLRNQADSGRVVLTFDINDMEIIVERLLKRGKTISQDSAYITINGIREEKAVSEIKSIILSLLQYPSEFSKKQNMLYKYTVYTPQESMKQIILEDPEARLNILRHIFGIDKYKRITENTSILLSKIREERKRYEGNIEDIDFKRQLLIEKESQLEEKYQNLSSMEKELFLRMEETRHAQEFVDILKEKIDEKRKNEMECEKLSFIINNKKDSLAYNNSLVDSLSKQISELSSLKFSSSDIFFNEQHLGKAKSEKEELNRQLIEISSHMQTCISQVSMCENNMQKILSIDECPTCFQNVGDGHKKSMIDSYEKDIDINGKKSKIYGEEKILIQSKIAQINTDIIERERILSELKMIQARMESLNEKERQLKNIKEIIKNLDEEISGYIHQLENIRLIVSGFSFYEQNFSEKQFLLENARKEEHKAHIKVAELRKETELLSGHVSEVRKEILAKEEIRRKVIRIKSIEQWLSDEFIGMVSAIEKNVMSRLKSEFESFLSKWFSILVSDNLSIRLDDEFTPIIEQQDYEIEYSYLSGGERTAVALAYRLALNQIINTLLSGLKTAGLIILDEPTDGFSDQQLDKIRDILEQINSEQIIIVSHEQKIEGFVDKIIRLRKEHGISQIEI